MKAGIGSYAFRWAIGTPATHSKGRMGVFGFLQRSAELDVQVVQICDNLPLHHLSPKVLADLKSRADELNLEIEVGIRGIRLEYLQKYVEICATLESRLLRVVLSDDDWIPTRDEAAKVIHAILPALKAGDVLLAVENHFDMELVELVRLVQEVNDRNVGICLDPFNSVYRLIHPETVIQLLAPFTLSAHVKDATALRYQTGFYITGCPLGQGLLNLGSMVSQLASSGKNPNLFLESWMDRLPSEEDTLRQEEEWIKQGLSMMKEKIAVYTQVTAH